eukprot:GHVT01015496.1.p2 GENE.GHVT01015496.1~~GHVT01015496.1.p2  ORF type:complete len:168 (+),score=23.22 GHVT01015496.1:146-649(+)
MFGIVARFGVHTPTKNCRAERKRLSFILVCELFDCVLRVKVVRIGPALFAFFFRVSSLNYWKSPALRCLLMFPCVSPGGCFPPVSLRACAWAPQVTGEPLITRSDDNVATFSSRLETYRKQTLPLVDYYSKLGLTIELDASKPPQEVTKNLFSAIDKLHDDTARRIA